MNFHQSHLLCAIIVFLSTTSCRGMTVQQENTLGSSLFFYQHSSYPRDCKEIQEQCSSRNSSGVFIIKPDGYLEPFEVYCDFNSDVSDGWTVIQRRMGGAIGFNRDWESYKSGFGFLSQEFWLGNDKLSFLTNQRKYQLVIEMTTFNGSLIRLVYDNFRISDGFSNYKLATLGQYSGSTGAGTFCRNNMVGEICSNVCQRTCEAPKTCQNIICTEQVACVCPNGFFLKGSDCVPPEECGCYESDEGTIIPEGESYVNPGCSRKGDCINGQVTWDEGYTCSPNAMCVVRDGVRQCICNEDYTGDGQTCTVLHIVRKDCQEVYEDVSTDSGLYMIKPTGWPDSEFQVYCNMSEGGGWTVFQRRVNGPENFNLGWDSYKQGFGDPEGEFWLGNDKIYYLTNQKRYELRFDLVNADHDQYYARFDYFRINDDSDNYRISGLGTYSGTAESRSNPNPHYRLNHEFTTSDRDNDDWSSNNCASYFGGGWWYDFKSNSYACGFAILNRGYGNRMYWHYTPGSYEIVFSEIKIRPI